METVQETSALKRNGLRRNMEEMSYMRGEGEKLQKNQIHCQRKMWMKETCTRKTERSSLWSQACWRVSIQCDERNSWQSTGSQADAKVSSGGIWRPLLQKKRKRERKMEKLQTISMFETLAKISADKHVWAENWVIKSRNQLQNWNH